MNRIYRLLAMIMAIVMLVSLYVPGAAEESGGALDAMIEGIALPQTYTLAVRPKPDQDDSARTTKAISVYYQNASGESALVDLALSFDNGVQHDAEFEARSEHYAQLVKNTLSAAGSVDLELAAEELNRSLSQLFKSESLSPEVISIEITSPYFESLTKGSRGDMVMKLQLKLIELGFLDDEADGQFGSKTAEGVMALQAHVRSIEQDAINNMGATDTVPQTELNGIADANLLAYFFSDQFSVAAATLKQGDYGQVVTRLQNRLIKLGCMVGPADGEYGSSTTRGVSIFQHYNGMTEDGIATHQLQLLLYSSEAARPSYPMLASGSRGDEVRYLQERLKQLGFMAGEVDGTYGPSTVTAVKKLQEYCQDIQAKRLTHKAVPAHISDDIPEIEAHSANLLEATEEPRDALLEPAILPEIAVDDSHDELLDPIPGVEDGAYGTENEPVLKSEGALDAVLTAFSNMFNTVAYAEELNAGYAIVVDGIMDPMMMELFFADDFPALPQAMSPGIKSMDAERMQRRLYDMEYLYSKPDGDYGEGTSKAIREFQSRNGLAVDGYAGDDTLKKLFSGDCKKSLKPYLLKISTDKQRVYAYAPDENEEYTRLVRTMKCSTGLPSTPTPKGTFQAGTGPGNRWHYFKKFFCWAQYAYYIEGDIMIHSVLYYNMGGRVKQSSINNLGSKASHGCVRMQVEDAKWIYMNCPKNTKVVVY